MEEREMIQRLMLRAKECLDAQQYYFTNKSPVNLRLAKAKEGALRNALHALRKRGYKPHVEDKATQLKLSQNIGGGASGNTHTNVNTSNRTAADQGSPQ